MASISFQLPPLPIVHGRSPSGFSLKAHFRQTSVAVQLERWCLWTRRPRRQQLLSDRPLAAKLKGPDNPNSDSHSLAPSPLLDVILKFYSSLNDKDTKRIKKLIAHDCIIKDMSFFKPLEGKGLQNFFERLTKAMGKHVTFAIDKLCEGKGSTVAVIWHIEWKGKIVPFTKGCSFYTCSKESETLLIKIDRAIFGPYYREALVFIETPLKPGDFALEMLKIIILLFDKFPKLAQSFLQKFDGILYYIIKIYKIFLGPLILPLLMYYTNIWKCAGLPNILINILQYILKIFR